MLYTTDFDETIYFTYFQVQILDNLNRIVR